MAVMRVQKTKNYTVMSNDHLKRKEMSLKAKGLLSIMLSLPDTWDYSFNGLVAIIKESETSLRSTLNELKRFGYVKVTKTHTEDGRFEYIYDIYEEPYKEEPYKEEPYQEEPYIEDADMEKPDMENPHVGNSNVENIAQLNTNTLNTKELSTNESNIVVQGDFMDNVIFIIDYLNQCAGTHYRASTKKNKDLIRARMNEGFTVEDFQTVIDKKCRTWIGTEWEKFLRPITLFGTKFESYLNEKVVICSDHLDPLDIDF